MAGDERQEKALKALGRSARAASREASSAAGPACLDEEALRALAAGQLPEARAGAVQAHLADCERCRRLLTLMATERRPLAPAKLEAVVADAVRELRAGATASAAENAAESAAESAAGRTTDMAVGNASDLSAEPVAGRGRQGLSEPTGSTWGGLLERLRALAGGRLVLPMATVAAVALLVVGLQRFGIQDGTGEGGSVGAYHLELSGYQQRYQGATEPPAGTGAPSGSVVVFTPTSRVQVRLEPAVAGTAGSSGPPPLAPDAASVTVLVVRADGSVHRLQAGSELRVQAGPGGILIDGAASSIFGEARGEVSLWVVVSAPGGEPPESTGATRDAVQRQLEQGLSEGRWWVGRVDARYLDALPTP